MRKGKEAGPSGEQFENRNPKMKTIKHILFGLVALSSAGAVLGQEEKKSSYAPVVPKEGFSATVSRMKTEKSAVMKKRWIFCKNAVLIATDL